MPSKKTIRIRPLQQTNVDSEGMPWAQERVYPLRDKFIVNSKETLHRVRRGGYINSPVHGVASRWSYDARVQTSYA